MLFNHYKRLFYGDEEPKIEKVMLLCQVPGSGKHLANCQTIKRTTIADATTLTEAGYVGEDVESVIERLLHQCNGTFLLQNMEQYFQMKQIKRSSSESMHTKDIREKVYNKHY